VLVRVAVESRKSKVEGKHTSPRPSPQRGEGEAISGSRHSSLVSRLTVRPDFVFRQVRLALFVDGCFWHGCPKHCKYAKWLTPSVTANNPPLPKDRLRRTGRAFWQKKLAGYKTRDRLVTRALRRAGWRVIRIWECALPRQRRKHRTFNMQHRTSNEKRPLLRIRRAMGWRGWSGARSQKATQKCFRPHAVGNILPSTPMNRERASNAGMAALLMVPPPHCCKPAGFRYCLERDSTQQPRRSLRFRSPRSSPTTG